MKLQEKKKLIFAQLGNNEQGWTQSVADINEIMIIACLNIAKGLHNKAASIEEIM